MKTFRFTYTIKGVKSIIPFQVTVKAEILEDAIK